MIELLTVVAVLLILIAMLLPALEEARYASMRTVCAAQVSEQLKVQTLYASSNNRRFSTQPRPDPTYLRWGGDTTGWWAVLKDDYLPDARIMLCPLLQSWGDGLADGVRDLDWAPVNPNYGGWNTGRSHILVGYAWITGFDFTPAAGELGPVNKLAQVDAEAFGITHRLDNSTAGGWDIGHGGSSGLLPVGYLPLGSTVRDQPIGYLDGHVINNPRNEFRRRFHHTAMGLGGHPADYYF